MIQISKAPGVYEIHNVVAKKVYVGSAVNMQTRIRNHLSALRNACHKNIKLQRAWSKYGEESFIIQPLETVSSTEQLVAREQFWIEFYRACENGYNIAPVAYSSLGRKATEETRHKQSLSLKGKKRTTEQRQKLKGRKVAEETRKKISDSNKGKLLGKSWSEARRRSHKSRVGRKHTPESIEKMRRAHKNRRPSREAILKSIESRRANGISEETRKKLSRASKRPCLEATKKKISEANKGRMVTISEATRKKISETLKGRPKPPRTKEHSLNISKGHARRRELAARKAEQVITPPAEPVGRAPDGQAFQR